MARESSSPELGATSVRSARLSGLLNVLLGFCLAIAIAGGLSDLAHRRLAQGIFLLIMVIIVRSALEFILGEWGHHAEGKIRAFWRSRLVDYFSVPVGEDQRSRGDLALAIERASAAPSLKLLETSAQVSVLGLALIFWSGGWLSCLICLTLLVVSLPLYQRAGKRSAILTRDYHQRRALLEARQLELLQHRLELRALGAVPYGSREIAAISDSEHQIAMRAIRVTLESSLITEFLSGVSIGLVAMVVGFGLLGGRLSLFHALAAVLVTAELFLHVRRYGGEFHRREEAQESLFLLNTDENIILPTFGPVLSATELITQAHSTPIDLSAPPGSRILITGPSGIGKTTLLHTLLGWRSPLLGSIERINGPIGIVSPESELFSASLWENVTLGRNLDAALVHSQLEDLGLGSERFGDLDAPLLVEGRGLSDGERVRVVLARCLLAGSSTVLLDDIAGVLDETARHQVRRALGRYPQLAIIETTVDTPLLTDVTKRIEIS